MTVLHYVARLCCDPSSDDEQDNQIRHQQRGGGGLITAPIVVESSNMMTRPTAAAPSHIYQQITAASSQEEEEKDDERFHDEEEDNHSDDCCCRVGNCPSSSPSSPPNDHGLHEFFRNLRERWRRYDSMETFRPSAASPPPTKPPAFSGLSPLRTASTFNTGSDIPTIDLEEVVLPGSALQQQMARTMSLSLEAHGDECVICMEGFDPTNPRMPTLCGCGQNKTYFHLPCLYQWMEQSEECPSCRQPLRWEEF